MRNAIPALLSPCGLFCLALSALMMPVAAHAGQQSPPIPLNETLQFGWVLQGDGQVGWGAQVRGVGDANADGYSDIVVARYSPRAGAFSLVEGRLSRESLPPLVGIPGPEDQRFGYALAAAGDVDGNGRAEFLIGAPGGAGEDGQASIHSLLDDMSWEQSTLVPRFPRTSSGMGTTVSGLGDVNGDGLDDVAVGVLNRAGEAARVDVIYGRVPRRNVTLPPLPSDGFSIHGFPDDGGSGLSPEIVVSGVGDVNADGVPDIALVSPNAIGFGQTQAWVVLGRSDSLSENVDLGLSPRVVEVRVRDARLGRVGAMGDWNGDGVNDIAFESLGPHRNFLLLGSSMLDDISFNLSDAPEGVMVISWDDPNAQDYGNSSRMSGIGDVDGDGFSDFIVGLGAINRACVVRGRSNAPRSLDLDLDRLTTCFIGIRPSAPGFSVGAAGDFNGDGSPEFLVGTPFVDGTVYLVDSRRVAERAGWGPLPAFSDYHRAVAPRVCDGREPVQGVGSIGDQQDAASPASRFWTDLCRSDSRPAAPPAGRVRVRLHRHAPSDGDRSFADVYWQVDWTLSHAGRTPLASVAVSYSQAEIAGLDESTLRLHRHDGVSWIPVLARVDTARNRIFALIPAEGPLQLLAVRGDPVADLSVALSAPDSVRNGSQIDATWRFSSDPLSRTHSFAELLGSMTGINDRPHNWSCSARPADLCPTIDATNFPGSGFSFIKRLEPGDHVELSVRTDVETDEQSLTMEGVISPQEGQPEDPARANNISAKIIEVEPLEYESAELSVVQGGAALDATLSVRSNVLLMYFRNDGPEDSNAQMTVTVDAPPGVLDPEAIEWHCWASDIILCPDMQEDLNHIEFSRIMQADDDVALKLYITAQAVGEVQVTSTIAGADPHLVDDPDNNERSWSIRVRPGDDLIGDLVATAGADEQAISDGVLPGQAVEFSWRFSNSGPNSSMALMRASAQAGLEPGSLEWTCASIVPGACTPIARGAERVELRSALRKV